MVSVSSLIVAVRTTGANSLNGLATRFTAARAAASNLNTTVSSLTRGFFAHQRTISTVAGAYRSADGLWRHTNGTLVTQRNHLRTVRTSWGLVAQTMSRVTRSVLDFISTNLPAVLGRVAAGASMFGTALVGIMAVGFPVIGALGSLLGLVELIAPTVGFAALAIGTLMLATNGFGAALSAGLSGKTEEFTKALKKLAPSAQSAVRTLVDLRNEWKRTQKAVQQSFFIGFRQDAISVSRSLQPLADKWLPRVAGSFRDMRTELAQGLSRFFSDGRGEAMFRNLGLAVDNVMRSVGPLARAFGDVLEVASPRFETLTSSGATLAEKFADWVRSAKESGKLGEWLDKAQETFGKLETITGNVLGTLKGIFRASSDEGQGMLDSLAEMTESMDKFANSEKGQQWIDTIASIGEAIANTKPLWGTMISQIELTGKAFGALGGYVENQMGTVREIVRVVVGTILTQFGLMLGAAAAAFGWIPGLGPKLEAAKAAFDRFAAGVNASLAGINDKTVTVTVERKVRGPALGPAFGFQGLASGTSNARRGWTVVGEEGPELMFMRGGEQVLNASDTSQAFSASRSGGSAAGGGATQVALVSTGGGGDAVANLISYLINNGYLRLVVAGNNEVRVA